ncbi:MBL fold metallo-hydrolase [Dietzia timorensis]|uniref:Metallo-beta-lactamase domain-containing protein n=1 Tax=Dietzia timorensis TaxID=499555 RepID=A0A173LHW2_9ACTN|nr:MBL fold metallo-hydrolase [Dietzia timorensis]ANI91916.1 Uncharacterized protein BJL86_1125 [Dietzia timorensis]
MQLTVIGSSGSLSGPQSTASCYLVEIPGYRPIVMDLGPGSFGRLQRYIDPGSATVMLSHLHADHCLDMPALLVWRRFGPHSYDERADVYAPAGADKRIGRASAEDAESIDDVSDTLAMHDWDPATPVELLGDEGVLAATVRSTKVNHPPLSYALRFDTPYGASLTYSGDTAFCQDLIDLATGSDVLLCEASWEHRGEHPEGIHMSGLEAGRTAREAGVSLLVLTHIPPWTDTDAVEAEARGEFDGEILVAKPGLSFALDY